MPKLTIVLVHGAWADGASWNAGSIELQGQGFIVLVPPNLLHGVAGNAAHVASFIAQRTTDPVVLVGHSYGGVVITNAVAGTGNVKALVYVDAFIPEVGWDRLSDSWQIGLGAWRCRPDRVRPPATQRRMAEQAGSTISEVAGSHVSMVSHPQASIDAILAAVTAIDT
jgi:pimeloyl-ACP methyl ester carboxylesterase